MLRKLLVWMKSFVIFFLLKFIYKNDPMSQFIKRITRNVKKRARDKISRISRTGVSGAVEEVWELPGDFSDEVSFVGFSKNGIMCYCNVHRDCDGQEHGMLYLELPGIGRYLYKSSRPHPPGRGPLKVMMTDPLRRWKVEFHGTVITAVDNEFVHMTLSLFWQCSTDPFDHLSSITTWNLAKLFANTGVLRSFLLLDRHICYDHWGEMRGKVALDGREKIGLHMKSCRRRRIFDKVMPRPVTVMTQHICVEEHGQLFSSICSKTNHSYVEKTAHVTHPCGERLPADMTAEVFSNDSSSQFPIVLNLTAHGNLYVIQRTLSSVSRLVDAKDTGSVSLAFSNYIVNGQKAYGVEIIATTSIESRSIIPSPENIPKTIDNEYVTIVGLQEDVCQDRKCTGGKGSNLAMLWKHGLPVPKGFCVTTTAFNSHVEQHQGIKASIGRLTSCLLEANLTTTLQTICSEIAGSFAQSDLSTDLKKKIQSELSETLGSMYADMYVAIRSSGLSEDGQSISSAGQLETFLNVKGLDRIYQALLDCWAFSFSYQVIEYRRQNGQCLVEPIGVIIQEMVNADVAGVLFTNDPMSGNSRKMVINAIPGQGESFVSGTSNPDFIQVRRVKNDETFTLEKCVIRNNQSSQDLKTASNTKQAVLCLETDQIQTLCRTGVEVERIFGCAQDVEWAISNGFLYLLQTRPITGIELDDLEDLIHEFDTPVSSEIDCITTNNIGEVLPGTVTPLTIDIVLRAVDSGLNRITEDVTYSMLPQHANKSVLSIANHAFLNMTQMCISSGRVPSRDKENMDMFLVGRVVSENTMKAIRLSEGRGKTFLQTVTGSLRHIIQLRQEIKLFEQWEKQVGSFTLGQNATDATDLYDCIDANLDTMSRVWYSNMYKTAESAAFSAILLGIFRGKKKDLSPEDNFDMSLLLSCCKDVESADVPVALQLLSTVIARSDIRDEFLRLPEEESVAFLVNNKDDKVRKLFLEFLDRHGHRCFREAELLEKSWDMDAVPLIAILKRMVTTDNHTNVENLSIKEALLKINKPLSWIQRFLFKRFLVPKARKGVAERERGKSVSIKITDSFKKAYWKLAKVMVSEGRLPEPELLFFLTHREIGMLLHTRSADLLRTAKKRKAVFPLQNTIKFPAINVGRPNPLKLMPETPFQTVMAVQGTTVCSGVVSGRACVVSSLQEAETIEKGDILICPYTDVGWTPFFSVISGVVTENGGLLSHGSVVAREMGIPCLVNVADVTSKFRTGDTVRLDGKTGTLQKITKEAIN